MKKILCIILALPIILCGCSNKKTDENNNKKIEQNNSTKKEIKIKWRR